MVITEEEIEKKFKEIKKKEILEKKAKMVYGDVQIHPEGFEMQPKIVNMKEVKELQKLKKELKGGDE